MVEERDWELFRTSYMIIGMVAFKQGYEGLFLHTNTRRETHRHRHIPSEQKHTGIAISGHQGAKLSETVFLSFPLTLPDFALNRKMSQTDRNSTAVPQLSQILMKSRPLYVNSSPNSGIKSVFNVIFFVIFYENIIVNKICKN